MELTKLKVSLTKHGAHKIALLLNRVPIDEVLTSTWGRFSDVKIDKAQAVTNLSARGGKLPSIWTSAKRQGQETVNALVLLAIVFSHHKLITAMKSGGISDGRGTIVRGDVLTGKEYTNFAHTLEELGYSTSHSVNHVSYDLTKLFHIPGLNILALDLFGMKFKSAGWDGSTELIDELFNQGIEKVFAIPQARIEQWLLTGTGPTSEELTPEDESFFSSESDVPAPDIQFKPGHSKKKTGSVSISLSKKNTTASLVHNHIQNELYFMLAAQYGEESVGTEIDTGVGTSIDLMVVISGRCKLYEIKTADSVRTCIRQAIPQLLEYAYWKNSAYKIEELIIVSPHKITSEAENYLGRLREEFKLPISYMQFVEET